MKGHKDKQWSTKHYTNTGLSHTNHTQNGIDLNSSRMISSLCSNSESLSVVYLIRVE